MFNFKNVLLSLIAAPILFFSELGQANTIFGPEVFNSLDGSLVTVVRNLDLGELSPGSYLLKIKNGSSNGTLLAQCQGLATLEAKRQCQYDNTIDRLENQLTRISVLKMTINGVAVSTSTLVNKSSSYLEFPIQLTTQVNQIKISVQGNPEAFSELEIVEMPTSGLDPHALFTLNSNFGKVPYKVSYNASQSFDPLNRALTYKWYVNGTEISSTKTGYYTFAAAGNYELKLKVTNSEGTTSELATDIVVLPATNPPTNLKPIPKMSISYPNPLNLRLYKVSSLGSVDNDGFITKTEINFGDGTPLVNSLESMHQYPQDGTYLVSVKVTDNLGATATIEKSISVAQNRQLSKVASVFGPIKYYGSFSGVTTFQESIPLTLIDADELYRIRVKNADGLDHITKICTGTYAEKIMCSYNNLRAKIYNVVNRVVSAQVYLNGKRITDSSSINKSTKSFETFVKLSQLNQLNIRVNGVPTAYVDVEIEKLGEVADTQAPILASEIGSDQITRSNLVHIVVDDNSPTSTEIYKNGTYVTTSALKEFDLSLTEGSNSFILKSHDALGNYASDFILNNIQLDSIAPTITVPDLKTNYYFQSLPQTVSLTIVTSEDASSATANGEALIKIDDRHWRYDMQVFNEVKTILSIKAKDLIGNEATKSISFYTWKDNTAPVIAMTTTLPATTKASSVAASFTVTETNTVVTKFWVNGVELPVNNSKTISKTFSLVEGINQIKAISTDIAGNVSNTIETQIVRDSIGPVMTFTPVSGAVIGTLSFTISGTSNEPLSLVKVGAATATLSADKMSFTYNVTTTTWGVKNYTVQAKDVLGNYTNYYQSYTLQSNTIPFITTNITNNSFTNNPNVQINVAGTNINSLKVLLDDEVILNANQASYSFALTNEGLHKLEVIAKNTAGTTTSQIYNFTFDQTAPFINLYGMKGITTEDSIHLEYNFYDLSAATFRVFVDQVKIFESTDVQGAFDVQLPTNGVHLISVGAIDAAGNMSEIISFETLKDNTAPVITFVSPHDGDYVDGASFKIKVTVDDVNTSLSVNSVPMTWNVDESVWEATLNANTTEDLIVSVLAINSLDLRTESQITVKPLVSALVPSLVGLYEDASLNKIVIKGADGSTRPNMLVNIKSGIFSNETVQADEKGAFILITDIKDEFRVSVEDSHFGGDHSMVLKRFHQTSLLSGIVKDNNDIPLSGVTVRIENGDLSTTTEENGVFNFVSTDEVSAKISGLQVITIDGTQVNLTTPDGVVKKFSSTKLNVFISKKQNNIVQKTIYLYPTYLNGDNEINAAAGGTVTSATAPGVQLEIPSSAASFPSGGASSQVEMFTVTADKLTVPPPSEALPESIVVLEPSGTTFSEPVQLTVPNSSNFPPKTSMVVMLFNSKTGKWEVGGAARVSNDGTSVVTKEGQGIRHFSAAYVIPPPADIMATNVPDKPGADSFSGSVTNKIELPSFKVLGSSVAPSLIYKSAWAKPSTTITNIFNIPEKEAIVSSYTDSGTQLTNYKVDFVTCTVGGFFGTDAGIFLRNAKRWLDQGGYDRSIEAAKRDLEERGIYPSSCTPEPHIFYSNVDYKNEYSNLAATISPKKVEMNFLTADVRPPTSTFKNIPRMAQLSKFIDLKNESGNYLPTGLYPYVAHYKIFYDKLITGTVASSYYSELTGSVTEQPKAFSQKIDDLSFGSDLIDSLFVQNYVNSEAGQGWKVAGVQKIVNPKAQKIMLEESDGSISTYAIKNSIKTVADLSSSSLSGDLTKGVGLNSWPDFAYTDASTGKIMRAQYAPENYSKIEIGRQANISARMNGYTYYNWTAQGQAHTERACTHFIPILNICDVYEDRTTYESLPRSTCHTNKYDITFDSSPSQYLLTSEGAYVLDSVRHSLGYSSGNNFSKQIGNDSEVQTITGSVFQNPTNPFITNVTFDTERMSQFASSFPGMKYTTINGRRDTYASYNACGNPANYWDYNGAIPTAGALNSPMSIVTSPANANIILVADSGNHRIVSIDISTLQTNIIAGDSVANDSGDGKLATQASIFSPQGLTFDGAGNLYISTRLGHIRKISTDGTISTIAGNPSAGSYLAEGDASDMLFNQPYGLAFDDQSNALYVSDTGNNRIVKIDMATNYVTTIAGNGQNGYAGDGGSAIEASLSKPTHLFIDQNHNLIVADSGNNRIRSIQLNNGTGLGLGDLTFISTTADNTKLVKKSDGSWERVYRDNRKELFSADGLHLKSVASNQLETAYQYDGNKFLTSVTFPNATQIVYNYSGGKLSSIKDIANRYTNFSYNGQGHLVRVNFPDGTKREFQYGSDGILNREYNQKNAKTDYFVNAFNRLDRIVMPDESTVHVNDIASKGLSLVDQSGVFTPRSVGLSEDQITAEMTDANGNKISFTKDIDGMISSIVDPRGRITKIKRDVESRPTEITDVDGSVSQMKYDATYGDLIESKNVTLNITTQKSYNIYGQVISETDPYGKVTSTQYNQKLLPIKSTASDGMYSTVSYSPALGLPTEKSFFNANGDLQSKITYEYDLKGRMVKQTALDGKYTTYTYDEAGNVLTSTSNIDSHNVSVTSYEYDLMNRLTKVISAKGEITEYQYSPTGDLVEIKDPNDKITAFSYDNKGQLISKTDPTGAIWSMSYDQNGNLLTETDPGNRVKRFTYNSVNKVTQIQTADDLILYDYNLKDEILGINNQISSINYIRDAKQRVVSETVAGVGSTNYPSHTINYSYAANDLRLSSQSSLNAVNYTYNQNNYQLEQIQDASGNTFQFGYDEASRLASLMRPGSRTDFAYSVASSLSSIVHSSNNQVKNSFNYLYDDRNYITQKRSPTSTLDYSYDKNGQLTQVSSQNQNENETFSYDALGNRIIYNSVTSTYDQTGQKIQDDGVYTYVYDDNANIIAKSSKAGGESYVFEYSAVNQLKKMTVVNAPLTGSVLKVIEYKYDPAGRRIIKSVTDNQNMQRSNTKKYYYDADNVFAELDGQNHLTASYTYSPMRPDDILSASFTNYAVSSSHGGVALSDGQVLSDRIGRVFYLKDHLNTITDIVDQNGSVIQRYNYTAFGKVLSVKDSLDQEVVISDAPIRTSYAYTGREYESETGFYYYRARYYDPSTGRFMQQDPDPGRLDDPRTLLSKYTYVANSPVMLNDPSGKIFGIDDLLFIGIVAAVGAIIEGAQNGWRFEALAQGALKGFALGAAFVGVASLIGAVQGGISGGTFLFGNFTFSGSMIGAAQGFAAPGALAYTMAAIAAIPAAIGMFDKNASAWAKNYANNYLVAGSVSNLVKAVAVTVGMPMSNLDLGSESYKIGKFVVNAAKLSEYNSLIIGMRLRLYGMSAAPLAGVQR